MQRDRGAGAEERRAGSGGLLPEARDCVQLEAIDLVVSHPEDEGRTVDEDRAATRCECAHLGSREGSESELNGRNERVGRVGRRQHDQVVLVAVVLLGMTQLPVAVGLGLEHLQSSVEELERPHVAHQAVCIYPPVVGDASQQRPWRRANVGRTVMPADGSQRDDG